MNTTLQTPKVYQYPETGRPDEGLEVYIWPNGDIDAYLNGRGLLFGVDYLNRLQFHLSPDVRFDRQTLTFTVEG